MEGDIQEANREKALGNECFTAKNYHEAIKHFTKAIDLNSEDHVFYSNRSACYANLGEYEKALVDAQICVDLNPNWAKGYLRRGLAEVHLHKYDQAEKTYKKGLELEPNNQQLIEGLQHAKEARSAHPQNGTGSAVDKEKFFKEAVFSLESNPDTAPFFDDPEYVKKLNEIKKDPQRAQEYMDDPKIKKSFEILQKIFSKKAAESAAGAKSHDKKGDPKTAEEEKVQGNEAYKNKNYESALYHYDRAIHMNPNEPIYHTNKAIVYLEMKNADEAIEACDNAIEISTRSGHPDRIKLAKAYARKASAYAQKGDTAKSVELFRQSLGENDDPKVREEMAKINLKK